MVEQFDAERAILFDAPQPNAYQIETYIPLKQAIETGAILPLDHCLVVELDEETTLVLPTLAMVYHHVAQGKHKDLDWVISYCALCNAGALFNAKKNNKVYHFAAQGFYDVMALIADTETGTFWNHLTGTAVHGEEVGVELDRIDGVVQLLAKDALNAHPNALFTLMDGLTTEEIETAERWNTVYRLAEKPDYGTLSHTIKPTDSRLPSHDMGIGIWTNHTVRYYSIMTLYMEQHGAIIDDIDGRKVVIVLDDEIGLPLAFYYDATKLEKSFGKLLLNDTAYYEKGVVYENKKRVRIERPNQNTIRWHGFSSLFPNSEIYGQS